MYYYFFILLLIGIKADLLEDDIIDGVEDMPDLPEIMKVCSKLYLISPRRNLSKFDSAMIFKNLANKKLILTDLWVGRITKLSTRKMRNEISKI